MAINVRPAFSLTWETDFDPDGSGGIPGAPQFAFAVNTADQSFWYHAGVGATDWIRIGSGSPASAGVTILQDGVDVGGNPHAVLDFTGAGVVATDAGGGVAQIAVAGAAASTTQVFEYEVTGLEPDPSEIEITLPTPTADAGYGVQVNCQGVANIAAFDVVNRTTTDFLLVGTGDLQAGDIISFSVSPLT